MWCIGVGIAYCFAMAAEVPAATAGATFCEVVKQQDVMWSRNDTRKTKENLDRVFRKGKAICGWGKK